MSNQGGDLLAWLDRVIGERERVAKASAALQDAPEDGWEAVDGSDYGLPGKRCHIAPHVGLAHEPEAAEHIVLNDPVAVLRRCAVDRKELARHVPAEWPAEAPAVCPSCARWDHDAAMGDDAASPVLFPCPSVLALAEGYGWAQG